MPRTRSTPPSRRLRRDRRTDGQLGRSWRRNDAGHGDVYYASAGRVSGEEVTLADGSTANLAGLYERGCPPIARPGFPLGLTDTSPWPSTSGSKRCATRRPPETSGATLAGLACAFTVLESAQAGRRVEVGEVTAGTWTSISGQSTT